MTLEEAINHCEDVVKEYEKIKCIKALTLEERKYAEEYRQIAEWLKELKQLREQTRDEKIVDAIDFAIKATDLKDDYSIGLRNGMRYAKSLIDGKKPQYEIKTD